MTRPRPSDLRSKLARRFFLKGVGATMALPLLDSMLPGASKAAEAAMQSVARNRLGFVFFPNGANMEQWTPQSKEDNFELSPTLAPLSKIKHKLNVMSELSQNQGAAHGDGGGDHARSAAVFLTGVHPVKTGGADIRAGVSIDQIVASQIGSQTKLPSLEIGIERGRNAGDCDSGYSCAYSGTVSWKTPTTPMAKEISPKLVFERLFGSGTDSIEGQKRRNHFRKSILDAVGADAAKLNTKLGQGDRRKMDEYFTSVREIEQRIERSQAETKQIDIPSLKLEEGVPKDLSEHQRQMYDLMLLAFQTDTTRVATFMVANEGTNRSYPMIGVNDGHHHLSHHQRKQDWLKQIAQIDKYLVENFAYFLEKMDSIQEGDGTLLDHSMIVYGGAISDGDRHNHNELPIILAGGGSGSIKTGRHLVYPKDTPLNNLFLSLIDLMQVKDVERFGDSTGRLDRLNG